MGNAAAYFAIFWTLVRGYLFIAYSIGVKLLRSQVAFINLLFLLSSSMSAIASIFSSINGLSYLRQVAASLEELPAFTPDQENVVITIAIVTNFAVIIGCLKFMWDLRHPTNQ